MPDTARKKGDMDPMPPFQVLFKTCFYFRKVIA